MTERRPDSAGFAVYRDGPPRPTLSCLAPAGFDWKITAGITAGERSSWPPKAALAAPMK